MDSRAVTVLRRSDGYLVLGFPPEARDGRFGATLEAALRALPGTLQTSWVEAEAKLLVRFDPALGSHAALARRVKTLLPAAVPVEHVPPAAVPEAAQEAPATGLAERIAGARANLLAATPERFRPMLESATTEKAVTNFFNDIVAFYLIKVHWDLIVNRWIKDPLKYGNAWLSVFYLVYLLVRYRKS